MCSFMCLRSFPPLYSCAYSTQSNMQQSTLILSHLTHKSKARITMKNNAANLMRNRKREVGKIHLAHNLQTFVAGVCAIVCSQRSLLLCVCASNRGRESTQVCQDAALGSETRLCPAIKTHASRGEAPCSSAKPCRCDVRGLSLVRALIKVASLRDPECGAFQLQIRASGRSRKLSKGV